MNRAGIPRVMLIVTRMNVGGVAVLLDNLMSNFEKKHFEVLLVTGNCESPERDYLNKRKNNYHVECINSFHKSLNVIDDIKTVLRLYKLIQEFRPDIVHTHTSKVYLGE